MSPALSAASAALGSAMKRKVTWSSLGRPFTWYSGLRLSTILSPRTQSASVNGPVPTGADFSVSTASRG